MDTIMTGSGGRSTVAEQYNSHVTKVFSALIPASSISVKVEPYGVKYLHPTKGWKFVSSKRFAIRGVM